MLAMVGGDGAIVLGAPQEEFGSALEVELHKTQTGLLVIGLAAAIAVAGEPGAVVVSDAWVRALPPGQANTAAYLTLSNPGDEMITVVGASSGLAGKVEIHTTREVDGYRRMEQLEHLELAPGQVLELAPGGTHLMLLGLDQMPTVGEQVRLCLQLAAGEPVCTSADVRKSAAAGSAHDHSMHQMN
jgi:copper(I)-binding protein